MTRATIIYFTIGFLFICIDIQAITISEATNNKFIQVSFENKGKYSGPNTDITITNNTKSSLSISNEPGIIITSEDSSSQNLVIVDAIVTIIKPKETFIKRLTTYCLNSNKAGPHQNERYLYKNQADKYLMQLIGFINQNKTKTDDNQSAIWAFANGSKTVFLTDLSSKNLALKKEIENLYSLRLKEGLIEEDKTTFSNLSKSFVVEGIFNHFVKEKGSYSASLTDSTGQSIPIIQNKVLEIGLNPIRFLHHYVGESKKTFFLTIEKDKREIFKTKLEENSNQDKYERYRVKSKTIFNIKNEVNTDLDIIDSSGNVYISYFKNQKMYPGIRSFDFSFTIIKPTNTDLFLALKTNSGQIISKQNISDLNKSMVLQGYAYIRLNRRAEGIFGLFDNEGNLIEEFKSDFFSKGLQMLPYGFMFDPKSKKEVFLKLIDKKNQEVLYQEKVFVKQ